jgi:hypothetical protein
MEMNHLPIIFIHKGYNTYLEFTLRQAKYSSPNSEIILLGDSTNDRFLFLNHSDIAEYSSNANEFEKDYIHYSTNSYGYELFCFQRWFIIRDFMIKNKINDIFVSDSDVLLYSSIEDIYKKYFFDVDIALAIYNTNNVSAGISYWKLPVLEKFCERLKRNYKDKYKIQEIKERWNKLKACNSLGGYSDMSAVTEFYLKNDTLRIFNLLKVHSNSVFDSQINLYSVEDSEAYDYRFGSKVFSWNLEKPYCYNKTRNTNIKFHLIHFQGPAKYLMAAYYTAPAFKGWRYLSVKFYFLNFLAFWYKILKIRYRFAFLFNLFNKK